MGSLYKTGVNIYKGYIRKTTLNHPSLESLVQFSSVQLISGCRLRGLPLCPDLRRSMRLIGHMGLSYDRIGRVGLSSACPIVA